MGQSGVFLYGNAPDCTRPIAGRRVPRSTAPAIEPYQTGNKTKTPAGSQNAKGVFGISLDGTPRGQLHQLHFAFLRRPRGLPRGGQMHPQRETPGHPPQDGFQYGIRTGLVTVVPHLPRSVPLNAGGFRWPRQRHRIHFFTTDRLQGAVSTDPPTIPVRRRY